MPSLEIEFEKFNGHVRTTLERIERKMYGTVSIPILPSFAVYILKKIVEYRNEIREKIAAIKLRS